MNPATIGEYYQHSNNQPAEALDGIAIDASQMLAFWDACLPIIQTTSFTEQKNTKHRFYYEGGPYPWGDAITLRAMIARASPATHHRNRIRLFHTRACWIRPMSATIPACGLPASSPTPIACTACCGLPITTGWRSCRARCRIFRLDRFDALQAGDILFIDSTHVMKTGSDVHYEMFNILPAPAGRCADPRP